MIFGKQISKPIFCCIICWGLCIQVAASPSAYGCESSTDTQPSISFSDKHPELSQVIENLKQSTISARSFHETYHSHMLTTPSHKEGTLAFHPPNHLEKHVYMPSEESFIIEGDSLLYENLSRKISRTFSLREYPSLATLVEGLRALFNGDEHTLRKIFHVSMAGTYQIWQLQLAPITHQDREGVDCIRLKGQQSHLGNIAIYETNGDRSELQLAPKVP